MKEEFSMVKADLLEFMATVRQLEKKIARLSETVKAQGETIRKLRKEVPKFIGKK